MQLYSAEAASVTAHHGRDLRSRRATFVHFILYSERKTSPSNRLRSRFRSHEDVGMTRSQSFDGGFCVHGAQVKVKEHECDTIGRCSGDSEAHQWHSGIAGHGELL